MRSQAHNRQILAVLAMGALLTAATWSMGSADAAKETARYTLTFVPSWNGATHPLEYPFAHAKQGLLTPMIGATHNEDFVLFAKGRKPSPGLERLSEMGKHDPLDAEIKRAIANGTAGSLIEVADGSPGPIHPQVSHTFDVDAAFPMFSIVGMIAPSPDWFYGVSSVRLREKGNWLPNLALTVYAWDSGGDAGATYMAEDQDLNPKQSTKKVETAQFNANGKAVPVGVLVFKRIPVDTKMAGS